MISLHDYLWYVIMECDSFQSKSNSSTTILKSNIPAVMQINRAITRQGMPLQCVHVSNNTVF